MNALARLGLNSRRGFGRITPDPFVLAASLTLLTFALALVFGDPPEDVGPGVTDRVFALATAWTSGGLWNLLAFAMQACVMLVLGTALAQTPAFRRLIQAVVGLPNSPRQLVGLTALLSIGLGLLNWSLSLIGGALLARAAGARARAQGWRLHYPILCAAAYTGLMAWHGGLSGTAPLKVTSIPDLKEVLGPSLAGRVGVMPLDETLLSPLNLLVSGGLLVLGPLFFTLLTPHAGQDPDPEEAEEVEEDALPSFPAPEGGLERIEASPWLTRALAAIMLLGLVLFFRSRGVSRLGLDTVNLTLWCLAMALHRGPREFLSACQRGVSGCAGIMIQFPLYAGIMGMMRAFGLSAKLTALVAGAGAGMLAPLTFLSAGLVNLFVPSGGGQWAVQGPIIMQAALDAGVNPAEILMAMAYGDQWTNMLQPFWALPLLAITGVKARDIVGYTVIWMVVGGLWTLACLVTLVG